MFYSIYRNGTLIGEKVIEVIEKSDGFDICIEVNVGASRRKIEASLNSENNITNFFVSNNEKAVKYNDNVSIYSNENFNIDEILMICYEKLRGTKNEYTVFSTENFEFYRMKFQDKKNGRYNILVPTYAYLEYDSDGMLGYFEDFKDGLQIIREE